MARLIHDHLHLAMHTPGFQVVPMLVCSTRMVLTARSIVHPAGLACAVAAVESLVQWLALLR